VKGNVSSPPSISTLIFCLFSPSLHPLHISFLDLFIYLIDHGLVHFTRLCQPATRQGESRLCLHDSNEASFTTQKPLRRVSFFLTLHLFHFTVLKRRFRILSPAFLFSLIITKLSSVYLLCSIPNLSYDVHPPPQQKRWATHISNRNRDFDCNPPFYIKVDIEESIFGTRIYNLQYIFEQQIPKAEIEIRSYRRPSQLCC